MGPVLITLNAQKVAKKCYIFALKHRDIRFKIQTVLLQKHSLYFVTHVTPLFFVEKGKKGGQICLFTSSCLQRRALPPGKGTHLSSGETPLRAWHGWHVQQHGGCTSPEYARQG